jgi:hypothetical protein
LSIRALIQTAACLTVLVMAGSAATAADPYTIVAIPDTQFYSQTYPATFTAQTQWIVNNQSTLNISYVTHEGDLVNTYTDASQWSNASTSMNILAASSIPYATVPGNHDSNYGASYTSYAANFGPTRYVGQPWYLGATSPNSNNSAVLFTGGSRQYLGLSLDSFKGADAIAFAKQQIESHPGVPTIVTLHSYYNTDGSFTAEGSQFWNNVAKIYPQVFMVMCGHMHGQFNDVDNNILGQPVYQMLADYQSDANGGNGYLRTLQFDEANNVIHVKSYSPTLGQYNTTANNQFDLSINFAQRFSNIQPVVVTNRTVSSGVVDTMLQQATPAGNNAATTTLLCDTDNPSGSGQRAQVLIKFTDLFGGNPNQIPQGATILSATLQIANNDSGNGAKLYRMLRDWNDTDTWNSLAAGVSMDGVEALLAADGNTGATSTTGLTSVDVTASIQAWLNGANNYGWLLDPNGTDGWRFYSAETGTPPTLLVTYTPEPTTLTLLGLGAAAVALRRRKK